MLNVGVAAGDWFRLWMLGDMGFIWVYTLW